MGSSILKKMQEMKDAYTRKAKDSTEVDTGDQAPQSLYQDFKSRRFVVPCLNNVIFYAMHHLPSGLLN